jgi:hypothetical protein
MLLLKKLMQTFLTIGETNESYLKLASKEDWFYVVLGIPVSVFAYIHWFI